MAVTDFTTFITHTKGDPVYSICVPQAGTVWFGQGYCFGTVHMAPLPSPYISLIATISVGFWSNAHRLQRANPEGRSADGTVFMHARAVGGQPAVRMTQGQCHPD